MKIKYLIYSAVLLMSSCNDDYLDRTPETSIGVGSYFNTAEDLQLLINNMYDFPGFGLYVEDITTDNLVTTGATEMKTIMTTNPSSETINTDWSWNKLRDINFFLANFKKANLTEAELNHYEGLARFFRARFYMDKVKKYSDVPWYDQPLSTNDEELLMKEQDPRAFIIDKIFEDYEFAANHVKEDQPAGAVNKYVVLSYLARHALYEGSFRKYHPELNLQSTANKYFEMAKNATLQIMNSGKYGIYSTNNPGEDYLKLFTSTDLTNNPEIILANISQNNLKNSGYWEYAFGDYESSPTRDLLQAYLMQDGSYYTDQNNYQKKQFVQEFENRDPRLKQTYVYPGFELLATGTYAQGVKNYVQKLERFKTGYHRVKGFLNTTDQTFRNNLDIPVVRYAEILLTYIESKVELNEATQDDLDKTINVLRDRVNMPHLTLSPTTDAYQAAKYPGINNPLLLEVRRERRIELALEGFRLDDLFRWGAGKLIEKEPEGIYFPGLGKYDLTGDGVEDIKLIQVSDQIPSEREVNSLGVPLIYYRVGNPGEEASVFLSNGTSGTIISMEDRGTFEEPKYYYRPVPAYQVQLNPNLHQVFGWN